MRKTVFDDMTPEQLAETEARMRAISAKAVADAGYSPEDFAPTRVGANTNGDIVAIGAFVSKGPHMQQESMLANALPYARVYGMPGESEVPPGMAAPLTFEERAYVQAKLDAERGG